jgi:hypothetical protein
MEIEGNSIANKVKAMAGGRSKETCSGQRRKRRVPKNERDKLDETQVARVDGVENPLKITSVVAGHAHQLTQ